MPPRSVPAETGELHAGTAVEESEERAVDAGDREGRAARPRPPGCGLPRPTRAAARECQAPPFDELNAACACAVFEAGSWSPFAETWRTGSSKPRRRLGLGVGDALDDEALEVGGDLVERLLHGQLERRGGRRAGLAAALEADARDAVRDVEQLDAAAVRVEVRAHLVERLHHALVEGHRVEVVDEEEAGDDAVLGHRVADRRRALARVLERLDDAAHALAIELDDRADELLGERPRRAGRSGPPVAPGGPEPARRAARR